MSKNTERYKRNGEFIRALDKINAAHRKAHKSGGCKKKKRSWW